MRELDVLSARAHAQNYQLCARAVYIICILYTALTSLDHSSYIATVAIGLCLGEILQVLYEDLQVLYKNLQVYSMPWDLEYLCGPIRSQYLLQLYNILLQIQAHTGMCAMHTLTFLHNN